MGSLPIGSTRTTWGSSAAPSLRPSEPLVATPPVDRSAGLWRRLRDWLRDVAENREPATVFLAVLGVLVGMAAILAAPTQVPWALLVVPVIVSGTLHTPRSHLLVLGTCLLSVAVLSLALGHVKPDGLGAGICFLLCGAVTTWRCIARAEVGVQGTRGEHMLADLRQMLLLRAEIPQLPRGWVADACIQSAYAHHFSGDFLVTRVTGEGSHLEAALVDISGKGFGAGSRSLALSGGFDALMGSVPPEDFLALANDHVARQDWSEGFASAVYLDVDLDTGDYRLYGAGHPPAIRYTARTGRWAVQEGSNGPLLGLIPGIAYQPAEGHLGQGDALVLYTDGLIEDRSGDLDDGIDSLIESLDALGPAGPGVFASRLCGSAPAGETDDRGVLVVWRR